MPTSNQKPGEHTVRKYDQELSRIKDLVIEMAELVSTQIVSAVACMRGEDIAQAREVIAREQRVNAMELEIDAKVIELLVRRQPMAFDLRAVLTFGKCANDLERMGDESERIARMTIRLYGNEGSKPSKELSQVTHNMSKLTLDHVATIMQVLKTSDAPLARTALSSDNEMDREFRSCLRGLATHVMEDGRNVGHMINLSFVLRALERIGDHCANIAEHVLFLVNGKDVRHPGAQGHAAVAVDENDDA